MLGATNDPFPPNVEVTLTYILMPAIGYNVKKTLRNSLKEKLNNADVGSRNVILPHFEHNIICSQKMGFTWLLNLMQKYNYMGKIRKNLTQKS